MAIFPQRLCAFSSSYMAITPGIGFRAHPNLVWPHFSLTNCICRDPIPKYDPVLRFQVDMKFVEMLVNPVQAGVTQISVSQKRKLRHRESKWQHLHHWEPVRPACFQAPPRPQEAETLGVRTSVSTRPPKEFWWPSRLRIADEKCKVRKIPSETSF